MAFYNNAPFNKMFREIAVMCSLSLNLSEKIYEGIEKVHSTCIAHPTWPG